MNWPRVLCDGKVLTYLGFRYVGHYFVEPGDYQDTPLSETLHFAWSVESLRGWHRMHNRSLMVTVQGLVRAHPLFFNSYWCFCIDGYKTCFASCPSRHWDCHHHSFSTCWMGVWWDQYLCLFCSFLQLIFFCEAFLWVSPLAVSSKMADTPTPSADGLCSLAVLTSWQIRSHGHSNPVCTGCCILATSVIGFIGAGLS
jgi:hypothetical protein